MIEVHGTITSLGDGAVFDIRDHDGDSVTPTSEQRLSIYRLFGADNLAANYWVFFMNPGYAVTVKDTLTNKITIAGDHVAEFQAADTILLAGSTADNGTQKITNVVLSGPDTVISVSSITNSTADGTVYAVNEGQDTIMRGDFPNVNSIINIGFGNHPPTSRKGSLIGASASATSTMPLQFQGVVS